MIKNFIHAIVGTIIVAVVGLTATSCKEDNLKTSLEAENIDLQSIIANRNANIASFMNETIPLGEESMAQVSSRENINEEYTAVYVDMPSGSQKYDFGSSITPYQMGTLIQEEGAEFSLINDGTFKSVVMVSNKGSKKALENQIKDSKAYLISKGFTESEIQEMLDENNADESLLVPFVINLTEMEATTQEVEVDWNRARSCAMEALGFDILAITTQSAAKTWSKVVLKKLFKTVATKLVGPVGAVIYVVEFAVCYGRQ